MIFRPTRTPFLKRKTQSSYPFPLFAGRAAARSARAGTLWNRRLMTGETPVFSKPREQVVKHLWVTYVTRGMINTRKTSEKRTKILSFRQTTFMRSAVLVHLDKKWTNNYSFIFRRDVRIILSELHEIPDNCRKFLYLPNIFFYRARATFPEINNWGYFVKFGRKESVKKTWSFDSHTERLVSICKW